MGCGQLRPDAQEALGRSRKRVGELRREWLEWQSEDELRCAVTSENLDLAARTFLA